MYVYVYIYIYIYMYISMIVIHLICRSALRWINRRRWAGFEVTILHHGIMPQRHNHCHAILPFHKIMPQCNAASLHDV